MLSQASEDFYSAELETDRNLAGLTIDLGAPVVEGKPPWLSAVKGENLIAEARRNKAAVKALADYAESLKSIASFDNDTAVAQSAEKLSHNLLSLGHELEIHTELNGSALAQAVIKLAKVFSDVKVVSVIKQKVKQAHPYVKDIVTIMVKDIERQQKRFSISRLNADVNRERWFSSFRQDYQSGKLSLSQRAMLEIAAGRLVQDELKERLSERPSRKFLSQLKRTAASCLKAHESIREMDIKENAGILIEFLGNARDLVVVAQEIK